MLYLPWLNKILIPGLRFFRHLQDFRLSKLDFLDLRHLEFYFSVYKLLKRTIYGMQKIGQYEACNI